MVNTNKKQTKILVLGAVMTALVIVFQAIGTATTFFGPFSTAVGLIPIVIGAAMCGVGIGAWLGFVFGVVVLVSGGAALFLAFDIPGTIITVLLKGTVCGLSAGLTHKFLKKYNDLLAVFAAAVICPVSNTLVFLLGCRVFFFEHADAIAETLKLDVSGMALFWALAMGNFLLEVATNAVLSPIITRILSYQKKIKI